MKHPDLNWLSSFLHRETDAQPKLDSPIVIVSGHIGVGKIAQIRAEIVPYIIEILDQVSCPEGKIIIVGAGMHQDKDMLHHHQLMQEGIQEGNLPVVGTIARKVGQIQEQFPDGLGHREELMQPIDIQLISRREDEDWGEQQCIATEAQLYHQQKKAAKYVVPKTQSAKKASNKPYRQRKK